jgi:hypothetical protein
VHKKWYSFIAKKGTKEPILLLLKVNVCTTLKHQPEVIKSAISLQISLYEKQVKQDVVVSEIDTNRK